MLHSTPLPTPHSCIRAPSVREPNTILSSQSQSEIDGEAGRVSEPRRRRSTSAHARCEQGCVLLRARAAAIPGLHSAQSVADATHSHLARSRACSPRPNACSPRPNGRSTTADGCAPCAMPPQRCQCATRAQLTHRAASSPAPSKRPSKGSAVVGSSTWLLLAADVLGPARCIRQGLSHSIQTEERRRIRTLAGQLFSCHLQLKKKLCCALRAHGLRARRRQGREAGRAGRRRDAGTRAVSACARAASAGALCATLCSSAARAR
jgi:hypothetical protein